MDTNGNNGNNEGGFDLLQWLANIASTWLETQKEEAEARRTEAQQRMAELQAQAEAERQRMILYLLLGAGALGLLFFYLQKKT